MRIFVLLDPLSKITRSDICTIFDKLRAVREDYETMTYEPWYLPDSRSQNSKDDAEKIERCLRGIVLRVLKNYQDAISCIFVFRMQAPKFPEPVAFSHAFVRHRYDGETLRHLNKTSASKCLPWNEESKRETLEHLCDMIHAQVMLRDLEVNSTTLPR